MVIVDQLRKNDRYLRALTWAVVAGMAVLLGGLWYVQVVSSKHFVADQRAQSFRTVRIPAIRGKILDRGGNALAENQPSYNVCLYLDELRERFTFEYTNNVLKGYRAEHPGQRIPRKALNELKREARYRAASNSIHSLSRALGESLHLDPGRFHRHYSQTLALPMPVLNNLGPAQLARFQEQPGNSAGLDLEVQPNRYYPHGQTAAHLLGYLTRDDRSKKDEDAFVNYRLPDYRGRVGVEGTFDEQLRGKAGVKSVLVNSLGYRQSEFIWTPADPGKNVVLTIDLELQKAVEEALASAPNVRTEVVRGAVVVMDPHTGDILAMASAPAFDPNLFVPRISHADYAGLSDPKLRPQVNRACQENYMPGSIFKIVTGLACLEAGVNPADSIHNPGYIMVGRRRIKDEAAPGEYDFRRAFIKSSNTYFVTNGLQAGLERILRIGEQLHLGERTGLPTGQEVSGFFPDLDYVKSGWFLGDSANLCIGQGRIDVTPLQMAVMTSAIANGGKVLWPRLVMRVEPQNPDSEEPPLLYPAGRVRGHLNVHPRSLQITRDAMRADVEDREGTGKAAAVPNWRVCGKTGTAQIIKPNEPIDHTAWFASYAPFEDPRYVVIVMVESGISGGSSCAPVAHKIYRALQRREAGQTSGAGSLARRN